MAEQGTVKWFYDAKGYGFNQRFGALEIIGYTGCELRTRQLSVDHFSARNEMGSR